MSQTEPGREQVLVTDEVSEVVAHHVKNLGIFFIECGEVFRGRSLREEVLFLLLGKVLVEDEAENVVLVFIRLDF